MTFVADIAAMLLAQPRVIFPAAGAVILGGGARTVGYLYAAAALGAVLATLVSGRLGAVRHQGVAIMVSIVGWGVGIAGLGVALLGAGGWLTHTQALWGALVAMAFAGGSDAVSAVFRTTILQSAAPDRMRGRLQGVFIVVVAGGPRVGELLGGVVAERIGEGWMAVCGGSPASWPSASCRCATRASCATTPVTPPRDARPSAEVVARATTSAPTAKDGCWGVAEGCA